MLSFFISSINFNADLACEEGIKFDNNLKSETISLTPSLYLSNLFIPEGAAVVPPIATTYLPYCLYTAP